jgi:hypothetical protein
MSTLATAPKDDPHIKEIIPYLSKVDVMLFPRNVGASAANPRGSHWILIAFVDNFKQILVCDSLRPGSHLSSDAVAAVQVSLLSKLIIDIWPGGKAFHEQSEAARHRHE